jgi:hypothetical protein
MGSRRQCRVGTALVMDCRDGHQTMITTLRSQASPHSAPDINESDTQGFNAGRNRVAHVDGGWMVDNCKFIAERDF